MRVVPFFSVAFLMLGSGLVNTTMPLKMKFLGYSDFMIGVMGSIYYLGMFIGSASVIRFLNTIGANKTFITTTIVLSIMTFIPALTTNLPMWFISRFISGYNLAWLYIIIESWILNASIASNRGKILAIYMIVLYLGQSIGQLFLKIVDFRSTTPFAISALLTLMALFPVVLKMLDIHIVTNIKKIGFRSIYMMSSVGLLGCVVSGSTLSIVYSLLPAYFRDFSYDASNIASMMACVIIGGVALQYPFGILSDRYNKKVVLLVMCFFSMMMCVAIMFLNTVNLNNMIFYNIALFLFGGVMFSIYPVSLSHTCDNVSNASLVEVTKIMMLAYGVGSFMGPVLVSMCMNSLGPNGLFYGLFFILLAFSIYMLLRGFIFKKFIENNTEKIVVETVPNTEI